MGHPGVSHPGVSHAGSQSWATQVCHTQVCHTQVCHTQVCSRGNPQHRKSSPCFYSPRQQQQQQQQLRASPGTSLPSALPAWVPLALLGSRGHRGQQIVTCSGCGTDKTLLEQHHPRQVPRSRVVAAQLDSLRHLGQEFTPEACLQFPSLVKFLPKREQCQILFQLCVLVSCCTPEHHRALRIPSELSQNRQ